MIFFFCLRLRKADNWFQTTNPNSLQCIFFSQERKSLTYVNPSHILGIMSSANTYNFNFFFQFFFYLDTSISHLFVWLRMAFENLKVKLRSHLRELVGGKKKIDHQLVFKTVHQLSQLPTVFCFVFFSFFCIWCGTEIRVEDFLDERVVK